MWKASWIGAISLVGALLFGSGCGDSTEERAVDAAAGSQSDAGSEAPICEEGLICDGACSACPDDPGVAFHGCDDGRCVAAACGVGYHTCGASCCAWQTSEIREGTYGLPKLSADERGVLHLLVADLEDDNLIYGRLENGAWSLEDGIDPDGLAGLHNDLAVGADGTVHIVYIRDLDESQGAFDTEFRYARRGPTGWEIETIDSDVNVGLSPSIALGPEGQPQVAYRRRGVIEIARRAGDAWSVDHIIDDAWSLSATAFAVDAGGAAHLAYRGDDDEVRYAVRDGDEWTSESVFDGGRDYIALAVGVGGLHVVHAEASGLSPLTMHHSRRTDSGWQAVQIDEDSLARWSPSVAMDSRGNLHLAFGGAGPELRYAHFTGLGWLSQDVDRFLSRDISVRPAIAVHDNRAHIVYTRDGVLTHAH
jgi:hypothetical protein